MQWNAGYIDNVFSFANNINTHEGGTHLSGFRAAITRTINDYARSKGFLKEKEENLSGEDVREGLVAILSVKLRDPQFEGQTKTKLGNSEIRGLRRGRGQPEVRRVPRGEPRRRQADHQQDRAGRPRPHGRPQGPRPHPAQERPREHHAARQAGRLLHPRPSLVRALPGGGRLRRRLGQAGARPELPGHPAAARQDHQRGEGPAQQDPLQHRDPGHHQRLRHQPGRRVRPDRRPLPQAHHHDRRRRRRGAHPHPHPHLPLPEHGGADRRRLRLHRPAAALPGDAQAPGLLRLQRRAARAAPRAHRAARASPCSASRAWAR